jgi:hypothetical protein
MSAATLAQLREEGKRKKLVRGRLGVMARVTACGKIVVGDAVSPVE